MKARLVLLSFAALLGLLVSSLRFVPTNLKTQLSKALAGGGLAIVFVALLLIQMEVYRSMTGIQGYLFKDRLFEFIFFTETIAFIIGIINIGLRRQRKGGTRGGSVFSSKSK